MKINKNFFIALLVFVTVMLLVGLFSGCTPTKQQPDDVKVERKGEYINYMPGQEAICIIHVEYNKHKYILFHSHNRLGVVHDPDCPCCKKQDSMFNW